MRYAIVSDIHANLQAWNAVLIDIRSRPVDRILCLGDVIGYGPNPVETLRSVYANVHDFVLGNHDAALCGKLDPSLFNEHARRLLIWTQKRLNRQATRFFRDLPLSLTGPGFRCTHGHFSDPARFDYVVEPSDALRAWQAVPEPLLFCGHTHVPCIFVVGASGTAHRLPPQDFVVEPGKRFLVNTGSVGQSRDGDTRASYLIYDDQAKSIVWQRIPFDLDAFRQALDAAGVREANDWFLAHDPRRNKEPLREMLGFNPPDDPDAGLRDTLNVREIQTWKHRAGLWRKRCAILTSLTLAGGVGASALYWQYGNPSREIRGAPIPPLAIDGHAEDLNRLPALQAADDQMIPAGWSARLGNRWRQRLVWIPNLDGRPAVSLSSTTDRAPLRLTANAIRVAPGQRFQLRATIRKQDDFNGSLAVVIGLHKATDDGQESIPRFVVQEPTMRLSDSWERAQRTFSIPAGGERLDYHIDGIFTGTVEIRDIELLQR